MVCAQMFLSGNPALSERSFFVFPIICDESAAMTLSGTVNKTAFSLVILSATASYVWNRGPADPLMGVLTIAGMFGGFVVAMVTVFKQSWAPVSTSI